MTTTTTNNIGAISALKGYRVQFLYTLYRILTYNESEFIFQPEGIFEDLDIQNQENDIVEIVQVKHLGERLTLSDIITTKKEKPFLKRAIDAYNGGNSPIVKLVSFGEINDEVKNLTNSTYSQGLIKKLNKLGLKNKEIELIKRHFKYEIVSEQEIRKAILSSLEKWGFLADFEITLDLLIYWIYYSAEKQLSILPTDFKIQFDKICKFQRERASFNKTFNSLIQPLDNNLQEENIDHLKLDFYKGISATYKHILADVDVVRIDKLNLLQKEFKDSNIVFIHGASGQGKSTLAYRFLKENCVGTTVYELKHLPENLTIIYDVINSLEGISKGIRFPITIYIDVEPGNKEWINVLRELASKKDFNFLVTIREEDWNSIEVGDKFDFSEIELTFEQEEAELIYNALDNYNKDLKFINFDNAWDYFGGKGPLLEFVYLITQNESLSAKLNSQINNIRNDSSDLGKEKMRLLRYIVLADSYGSKVKLKELNQYLQLKNEIFFLINLLQKEYLLKISGDKSHIIGLHPVRSKIIKGLLFDDEIYKESDFALDALSFISDNTALVFLRNAFKYSGLLPEILIERLKYFEPKSWQMYLLIFKGLLWKGIADYTKKNNSVLNQIYTDYGNGWKIVVNFDFASIIEGGSIMENSDIFTEEQRQYAKSMNQKFSDKNEVFLYCLNWLHNLKAINIIPQGKHEWDSFGLFLFWLNHFNNKSIVIDFNQFEFEENLRFQPLVVIAHTLYALKVYSSQSFGYVDRMEKIFLQKISEKYNIISIQKNDKDISCHYLFDIVDEEFEMKENDFINAKSMKIIDLLRFAFPEKEYYNSNGIGHQFSFLSSNHDSSIKQIPRRNLPLKPLVEINSTYINLFEYTKRPNSWQEYVNEVVNRRLLLIDVMSKMTKAFNLYHKQKHLKPLADYVHEYTENYHQIIKDKSTPDLPQNIIDEWGEYGEGSTKKVKSNFNFPESLSEKKELKQILALKKYSQFLGLYRDLDSSIENFLWQSAESIFRKIKISLKEDVSDMSDNARVSLVGNLFKAFEVIDKFQKEFKLHFVKFIDSIVLKKIENLEINNISILCFLYRQFIYSDSFIVGNASKIAIKRLIDTESNIKKKISNGLKAFAKRIEANIKVEFDEKNNRCVILVNHYISIESFQLIELLYNKLYELLEQPDYTSIKYLILNTKYPIFNIILLISGKSINSTCYEFKTYNLREKRFDELEQFNLIPQKIPSDIIEKHSIESWNIELNEFKNLDKLLESVSTVYQLAFHFSQLGYFKDKTVEDYNENILKKHVDKIGSMFQTNLQKALDIFGTYIEQCNNPGIEFTDDVEKLDFFELFNKSHKFFYPNDMLFEKRKLNLSLGTKEIEGWIPRLEQLVNNISIIYYFLAGKIIEKKTKDFNN
ncbi:MAG: hypothetical protein WC140_07500 [Bacteroidales bacterium]